MRLELVKQGHLRQHLHRITHTQQVLQENVTNIVAVAREIRNLHVDRGKSPHFTVGNNVIARLGIPGRHHEFVRTGNDRTVLTDESLKWNAIIHKSFRTSWLGRRVTCTWKTIIEVSLKLKPRRGMSIQGWCTAGRPRRCPKCMQIGIANPGGCTRYALQSRRNSENPDYLPACCEEEAQEEALKQRQRIRFGPRGFT